MSKANKQTRVEEECVGISFIQKAYAISALFFPSIYSLCRHKCFIRSVQFVGWTQTMNENRYDEPTDQNDAYHWSVADSGVLIVAIIIKIKVISCFHNRPEHHTQSNSNWPFSAFYEYVQCAAGARSSARMHLCVLFTVIFIVIFIILSLKLKAPANNANNNSISCKAFFDCLSRLPMCNATLVNCVDWWCVFVCVCERRNTFYK